MTDDELKKNKQDTPESYDKDERVDDESNQETDDALHEPAPTSQGGQDESNADENDSSDADPFAELRRNLKEDAEVEKEKKQNTIVGRITKKLKRTKKTSAEKHSDEKDAVIEEKDTLDEENVESPSDEKILSLMELAEESEAEPVNEDDLVYSDEQKLVKDFILSLDTSEEEAHEQAPVETIAGDDSEQVTQEAAIPGHGLKDGDEDYDAMRKVALEGYGKEAETESAPEQSLSQRIKVFRKGLKPVERLLLVGVVGFIVVACLVMVGSFVFPRTSADEQAVPVPTLDLPFPVRLKLAGSGYFDLHRGKVTNGKWKLKSQNDGTGEWLEGTEVCKWVALPWNIQLEAVMRSLTPQDEFQLTMSNADVLTYQVYSIKNVPVDQIETLERNGACLLVILANEDSDTRWVVTALP